jgi:hypothetical protein
MVLHITDQNGNPVCAKATINGDLLTINDIPNNNILLTSESGIGVYADSSPVPTADINNRQGWLFKKTVAGTGKFNYYYYSQGSHAITLGDIKSLISNLTIDHWTDIQSAPFFVVYTKPTGVGDAGAWYHSRRAYSLEATNKILLGESINMYAISEPNYTYNDQRLVKCGGIVTTGTALDSEEILTISLHSDSGAAVNTQILVRSLGVELTDGTHTYFNLIA